jgi:hypothetical protein
MRKHAPMWEAELGRDNGIIAIDVLSRKFQDDIEDIHEAEAGSQRPSWTHLLLFLASAVIFLTFASGVPFRG